MKSRLTTKLLVIISFVQGPISGNSNIDDCEQGTNKAATLSDRKKQALAHLANADYREKSVSLNNAKVSSHKVSPDLGKMGELKNLKTEQNKAKLKKQVEAEKRARQLDKGYVQSTVKQTHAQVQHEPAQLSHRVRQNAEALKETSKLHMYSDREAEKEAGRIGKELIRIRKHLRNTELQLEYHKESLNNQLGRIEDKLNGDVHCPKANDLTMQVTADIRAEGFAGKSTETLNENYIDSYGFGQQTIDLGLGLEKKNRYNSALNDVEAVFVARTKGVFGNPGIFAQTEATPLKIGISKTENSYKFKTNKQPVWTREAWLKFNWNNSDSVKASVTAGLFPYQTGCGLALGNANDVGRQISALYTDRFIDQYRAGVKFEIHNKAHNLNADIYYGVIDNKSSSIGETGSFVKANLPAFRDKPYRGTFIENYVLAGQLKWTPETTCHKYMVNPYVVYNENKEDQVEVVADATSSLGIFGLAASVSSEKWECYNELALNFGQQNVKDLDRNIFEFVSSPRATFLFQDPATRGSWTIAQRRTFPENLSFLKQNCDEFTEDQPVTLSVFKNACNRYRSKYKNSYRGFMCYSDLAYYGGCKSDVKTTWGLCTGFSTGDFNPNDSKEKLLANRIYQKWDSLARDSDKVYKGFNGVQQMFPGKSVKNVFLMDAHKMNRPVSTPAEAKISYPEFTNMLFAGTGFSVDKNIGEGRTASFSLNGLAYYQTERINKGHSFSLRTLFLMSACPICTDGECTNTSNYTPSFTAALNQDACKPLGKMLGWELNAFMNWQPVKDLNCYMTAAMFFPGSYYKAAQGKYLPIDVQYQLSQPDYTGYEQSTKYDLTLASCSAFFFNAGFEYQFDSFVNLQRNSRKKVRLP